MIDLNAIEKGEIYRDLKESIVIFICKFDPFGEGLSKYTFENICNENKELYLKDGTSKVFFNTKDYYKESKEDTKSFLEYIEKETISENNFVKKLEQKIRNIKENKEWRAEYMKSLLREQEIARDNFEKGKIEGIAEGVVKGREEERENGINKLINTYRKLNIDNKNIISSLIKEYDLTKEEAEKYLK